jgi:hypothetical protein
MSSNFQSMNFLLTGRIELIEKLAPNLVKKDEAKEGYIWWIKLMSDSNLQHELILVKVDFRIWNGI